MTGSPFTASAARSSNLLTVLVHHGEALDALVPALNWQQNSSSEDASNGGVRLLLSSFVVVSVGSFAPAGSDCVECVTVANTRKLRGDERQLDDDSDAASAATEVLYESRYSPFAATRVVESCNAPAWNELLALSLPFEWRESSAARQHQQHHNDTFALKVELVQRGSSQQEDFLLATAIIPLLSLPCHRHQVRLALRFAPAASHAAPAVSAGGASASAQIFIALRETIRDCFEHPSSLSLSSVNTADRVEVLVERFVPAAAAPSEVVEERVPTQGQPHLRSLALGLAVSSSTSTLEQELLSDLFTVVKNGSSLELLNKDIHVAVTPSATANKLSVRNPPGIAAPTFIESVRWHYPLMFELSYGTDDGSDIDINARAIEVALFDTRNPQQQNRIGTGKSPALQMICQLTASNLLLNGERHSLEPPVAIYSVDSQTSAAPTLLGHLHATVRGWSHESWTTFVRDTPTRRVVSSNRSIRKNSAMLALGWTGALLRGLNRYPVSSFCDEGGLSSVLAGFLSASSSPSPKMATTKENEAASEAGGPVKNVEVNALLVSQISLLQAESTAQRQQIERLQAELDERLKAVQTCGRELVVLRREVRAKEKQLEEVKAELVKAAARERQQMEQLLSLSAPPSSSYGGAMDNKLHQQLTLVVTRYKDLECEHQETKAQLGAAQQSLELARALETRYTELEQAHMAQAAQVQRLQRERQQVSELKRAVRLQEKVIQQFEAAVSLESASEIAAKSAGATTGSAQVAPARALVPVSASGDWNDALLSVRVRVLEEQLAANARDAASEISRLKLRILELESGSSKQQRPSV